MARSLEKKNTREVNKLIKKPTERCRKQINVVEDRDETVLTGSSKVAERWKEYCNEIYNYRANADRKMQDEDVDRKGEEEDQECELLRSEVEAAIRSFKKDKSPGVDSISAELIQ